MTVTITLEGVLLAIMAVLAIILLIYLILLVRKLIATLAKVDDILVDTKVVSETASDKAKQLDGIVDGISISVGTVIDSIKGNQSIVAAAANIINAASNFAGIAKRPHKKEVIERAKKED